MKAHVMVLAAGLGTRLWPLTEDRAKPAVPFLGRPLVARLTTHLAVLGVSRVVVNTHHRPESVRAALADAPIPVAFSHEDEILGTAGALACARDRGLIDDEAPTIVVNGKLETDIDLRGALETHRASGAAVTMVLTPNRARAAFREVYVEEGRIVGFGVGREPETEAPLLFTGIHVLAPEVVAGIPVAFCDTVRDVYPPLIEAGRVFAHVEAAPRWWEFSTLERYLALHHRAADLGLCGDVILSSGSRVEAGARIRGSVLWEGATVRASATVEDAILGADVTVHPGETFRRVAIVRRDRVEDDARGRIDRDRVIVPIPGGAGSP